MNLRRLAIALLAFNALAAQAASIRLLPVSTTVAQNDIFTVNLDLDASDAPGNHPGLHEGNIVIDFDPVDLTWLGVDFIAPAMEKNAPVSGSSGSRQTVALGFYNAADLGTIASFSFKAIGSAGTSTSIGITDADDFFGTFVSTMPTKQRFYPEFYGATLELTDPATIPLPAGLWLLASGFGLLGLRARYRHNS